MPAASMQEKVLHVRKGCRSGPFSTTGPFSNTVGLPLTTPFTHPRVRAANASSTQGAALFGERYRHVPLGVRAHTLSPPTRGGLHAGGYAARSAPLYTAPSPQQARPVS